MRDKGIKIRDTLKQHILNNKNESAIKYIGEEYKMYIVNHEQQILTSTFNQTSFVELKKVKNRL